MPIKQFFECVFLGKVFTTDTLKEAQIIEEASDAAEAIKATLWNMTKEYSNRHALDGLIDKVENKKEEYYVKIANNLLASFTWFKIVKRAFLISFASDVCVKDEHFSYFASLITSCADPKLLRGLRDQIQYVIEIQILSKANENTTEIASDQEEVA